MSRSKKGFSKDPHRKREREKYANPIASREFIMDLLAEKSEPLPFEAIRQLLKIERGSDEHLALKRRLRAMERDGQVILNRSLGYGLIDKMDLFRGRVQGRGDGDGLLIDEDNQEWGLSAREMRKVMHGDTVLARDDNREFRGRKQAKVVEVVDHKIMQIVGQYQEQQNVGFVVPDDKRIAQTVQIDPADKGRAKAGEMVVVALTQRPSYNQPAIGKIIEVLGEKMAPGIEIEVAIRTYGLPHEWPKALKRELKAVDFTIPKREYKTRRDLSDLPLVTIDGEDAKDFDDAVYCERKRGGGWRLWVAIADVSYYVQDDTALDIEARERGTSVYFPGQVIPMLPEVLSNGLCSLKPEVDRRCMVCEMTISENGRLSGYQFYPAIMRSHARLTYNQVAKMLETGQSEEPTWNKLIPHLQNLYDLYKKLRVLRAKRGALEFESPEPLFLFSEERKISDIVLRERNDAHKIIEECMILANISAAKFLEKHDIKALVRNHLGPNEKKLNALKQYLAEKGLALRSKGDPTPEDYAELQQRIAHRLDADQIQTMLLRSMNQAVYAPDSEGHFGLALKEYAHFTSPIRRYPDLVLHRVIKAQLAKETGKRASFEGRKRYSDAELDKLGEHCSFAERRAEDASRDVNDWLKCEFMQDKVGAQFEGVVTGVTPFGLFVRLHEYYIEGLIHVTQLQNDYYHFDQQSMVLVGEKTRMRFGLGDELQIVLSRVDLDNRRIDFDLLGMAGGGKKTKSKGKRGQRNAKAKADSSNKTGENAKTSSENKSRSANKGNASKGKGSRKADLVSSKSRKKKSTKKKLKKAVKKKKGGSRRRR